MACILVLLVMDHGRRLRHYDCDEDEYDERKPCAEPHPLSQCAQYTAKKHRPVWWTLKTAGALRLGPNLIWKRSLTVAAQ
jgi:hypothetical protein